MYSGDIDWHSGVIRIFEPGKSRDNHDPYVWCCTVQRIGEVALLKGVREAPSPSIWRAIASTLAAQGMKTVEWERWTPGSAESKKTVRIRIG